MNYLEMWARLEITSEIVRLLFIIIGMALIGIYSCICLIKGGKK